MEVAPSSIAAAVAARHRELEDLLGDLEEFELRAPSSLPGWSRLTVLCHLRYGAEASLAITEGARRGERVAFYPDGRNLQRPWTLLPRPGEAPFDVVREARSAAEALDGAWADLGPTDWDVVAVEPVDNADLGPLSLGALALLRLTEVEVHGTDLEVGAAQWSGTFVAAALPMRLRWLATRRSNHQVVDGSVRGAWTFRPDEGVVFVVRSNDDGVSVVAAEDDVDAVEFAGPADALLGFLLGRVPVTALRIDGDRDLADAFLRAFPSP